jgi:hypothetical protein
MYCNYCGSLNPNDAVFCSKCGRRTSNATSSASEASNSVALPSSIPSIPSEPRSEEVSSWRYKEMGDEELEQLLDAYQKLRVPIPQHLQSEVQRRSEERHSKTSGNTLADDQLKVAVNSAQTATQAVAAAKPKSTSSTANYGWFVFSLVCFTVSAASVVFQLAAATAKGSADAFPKGGPFLAGLIATAIGAKTAWSRLVVAEPEDDPVVRRKHSLFLIRAVVLMVLALVAAGSIGVYLGKPSAASSAFAQMATLGARTAPIKQRFVGLVRKDTPTIPEYLRRCTDLESTLNEYEPALQQMDGLMAQLQEHTTNDPSTIDVLVTMRSILQKDLESAKTFRKEVESAKLLAALPSSEQTSFYNTSIKPIQDEESRIANDEIEIMKRAKARGVKLGRMYKEAGIE